MSRVGFEATIPVFEPAKTVYALDRAATVISTLDIASWAKFDTHDVSAVNPTLISMRQVAYILTYAFILKLVAMDMVEPETIWIPV
jgi:hypothetical protein